MDNDMADNAGVIALPPVIFAAFLGLGLIVEYLFPQPLLPREIQVPIAIVVIALSVAVMPSVMRRFRQSETSFDVRKATTALIVEGPYRYSRNPTYLAMVMLYLGIGIAVDGLWIVLLAIPLVAVMHYGVIRREERYLEQKFGDDYRAYCRKVRRWI